MKRKQKKWNSCTAHKKNVFVTLYPAADDEFERFDSCRTGIRDGRLCVDVRSGKTLSRELEVIEEEDFLFVFFALSPVLGLSQKTTSWDRRWLKMWIRAKRIQPENIIFSIERPSTALRERDWRLCRISVHKTVELLPINSSNVYVWIRSFFVLRI